MKSDTGLLHNFDVDRIERRQYERVGVLFAFWWLQDARVDSPVSGIGIEISGGGLQFLLDLKHVTPTLCNIVFEINGRKMRANVRVIRVDEQSYKDRLWHRHSAKFEGLLASDFEFIVALRPTVPGAAQTAPAAAKPHSSTPPGAPRPASAPAGSTPPARSTSKMSIGSADSHNMLPAALKGRIVAKLVALKRIDAVDDPNLARMAAHYGGIQPAAQGDPPYHRFSVRSKKETEAGAVVFDTQFLVSDDGATILQFE